MVSPSKSHRRMMKPSKYVNYDAKGFIKLALFVGFLIILAVVLISAFNVQKEPVTADSVYKIIEEQGYKPQDITNKYYEHDPAFKDTLVKCVAFEAGDIRFDYFEFNNQNSAVSVYSQAYNDFIMQYDNVHKIETDNQMGNFSIYTLDSLGKYNVAIYVENTAVYANCDSENKNEINKILDAIDYLKP